MLGHLDVNVLSIMKIIGFESSSAVDANWIAAYGAPFPTRDDCIGAIEFPLEVLLGRFLPYVREGFPLLENLKAKPAMLTVGMKDRAIAPDVQIVDFRGVWPDRPIVKLPEAGHFSQEDAPGTIVSLIQAFVVWPALARASAVRRPKPLDAPVTSMILLIADFLVVWAPIRREGAAVLRFR